MQWKETWLQSRNLANDGNSVGTHLFSCKFHTFRHKFILLLKFGFSKDSSILHKHFLWLDMCACTWTCKLSRMSSPSLLFRWEYGCFVHPQAQGMLRGKCRPDHSRVKARKHLLQKITETVKTVITEMKWVSNQTCMCEQYKIWCLSSSSVPV